jgi:hypothetical protein
MPAFNKTTLIFRDDSRESIFYSISYNFGEDFVAGIAKGDRTEPVKARRSSFFRISAKKEEFVPPPILTQDWDFLMSLVRSDLMMSQLF